MQNSPNGSYMLLNIREKKAWGVSSVKEKLPPPLIAK